jgi:multicomponent K+:H+ antiporter subunit C
MTMEALIASALAVVVGCGVFLVLRGRTFPVIIGLSLLGYAVNFFIFVMGRLVTGMEPILRDGVDAYTDPLPQALVLTAIVIGFAMTGFVLEIAIRARHETGSDHVDVGHGIAGASRLGIGKALPTEREAAEQALRRSGGRTEDPRDA